MTKRILKALPYIVLLCAWALFFWRFAASSHIDRITYPAGDFTQQIGVFRDAAFRSLLAGRLPVWAVCLYSGYPFSADPQAQVFCLPVWLTYAALRVQGRSNFPIGALVAEISAHYMFWLVAGLRLFHGAERFALIVSFALAVLAALGADYLFGALRRPSRRLAQHARLSLDLLVVSFGLMALLTYLAQLGYDPSARRKFSDRAGVMTLGMSLTALVLNLRARGALRHWLPALPVGVAMLDLFAANRPLNVVAAPDDAALNASLADPTFDPFATAVLAAPVPVSPSASDRISVILDQAGHIVLHIDSSGAGVLVVSEAYFPGWQANADGQAAALLRANGALLAVNLTPGAHEVSFVYQPRVLLIGGVTSILGLLLVVVAALCRSPQPAA